MDVRPRDVAGQVVAFVARTERRRVLVAVGVPALFVVGFDLLANFGLLVPALGAGLAVFLYTRATARETVAASAYGVGTLTLGLFGLVVYWSGTHGSTESVLEAATRVRWWAVASVALLGLGHWLRRVDR